MQRVKHQSLLLTVILAYGGITASAQTGEELYAQNCTICHGEEGTGAMPGIPDLTENRVWASEPVTQLITRIKQGIQSPNSAMPMPPNGGNSALTDEDLKNIIQFMRTSFLK